MFDKSAELYDLFYDWKDYGAESARVREIVEGNAPGARTLLDVACGTGRHLEHLRAWYAVEGLDIDGGLLAVARERLGDLPLHRADMLDFDLGRTFDVVTCLFSSIGYVQSVARLERAVASMARHLAPSGLLIVEPWLSQDEFDPSFLGRAIVVEQPGLHAVRMNGSRIAGTTSVLEFHYLITRPGSIEHLTETHTLGLFNRDQYRAAFEKAGLKATHDAEGLMGRGLWIGRR